MQLDGLLLEKSHALVVGSAARDAVCRLRMCLSRVRLAPCKASGWHRSVMMSMFGGFTGIGSCGEMVSGHFVRII